MELFWKKTQPKNQRIQTRRALAGVVPLACVDTPVFVDVAPLPFLSVGLPVPVKGGRAWADNHRNQIATNGKLARIRNGGGGRLVGVGKAMFFILKY